jgi:hypothetical protein
MMDAVINVLLANGSHGGGPSRVLGKIGGFYRQ